MARSWALLHQPMYHTFSHHDAEGFATWVHVLEGNKFWVTLRPSGYDTSENRRAIFQKNADYRLQDGPSNNWCFNYASSSLRYIIYAEKGDIMSVSSLIYQAFAKSNTQIASNLPMHGMKCIPRTKVLWWEATSTPTTRCISLRSAGTTTRFTRYRSRTTNTRPPKSYWLACCL